MLAHPSTSPRTAPSQRRLAKSPAKGPEQRVAWLRITPFLAVHASLLLLIVVGWSPVAVAVAGLLYLARMFAITGGYHRYFSHRTFKTSRVGQFLLALLGAASVQRGPIWWAAHHRHHHRHSDTPEDVHSPRQQGFLWSHVAWFTTPENHRTRWKLVPDLARFRELRFLDRFDAVVPVALGASLYGLGALLQALAPELGTTGWQMFLWGFSVSTVLLWHATFTINSLSHVFGSQRYATGDDSRNNPFLALITLGEGWHNNHHHYPHSVRQGFRWWEFDITYMVLRSFALFGLVWDLKPVPAAIRSGAEVRET